METKKRVAFTVVFDPADYQLLRHAARHEDRPVSAYVRRLAVLAVRRMIAAGEIPPMPVEPWPGSDDPSGEPPPAA